MTIHKCSQTYKVCPNLQSVPKITKCAQYRDFHSRDSETCVQALVLPSRPAASMRGRSAKKNLGGCEKSIWESVLRVHPHLRGHFGRLRLNLEDMDRATFIGLWYKASTLAHTGGMAAARLLHPVFGGCISARELMLTYGKLTQSVGLGYPRFRREWVCKGMRNDFVAWLLHPAFTAKDREAAQVEHVEINRVLELQRAHEQAVDNLMPCAVECGCANVLNESLVEVRMTAHKNQGLFAVKDVEKDQWLSAYGGVRRSVKELDKHGHGEYVIVFRDGVWAIDGRAKDCKAHFANHECKDYNAELSESLDGKHIHLRALRFIPAGSEVCVNYGPNFVMSPCWCSLHQGKGRSFGVK